MMKRFLPALLSLSFVLPSVVVSAEEVHVGKTVESRFTLAVAANPEAAQALLPEGWKLLTLPKGPLAGANTFIVLLNKHLQVDSEGKAKPKALDHSVALVNYAVQPDKPPRLYVTKTIETGELENPYGNSIAADIEHAHRLGYADGQTTQAESWVIRPITGGELRVDVEFVKGVPSWGPGEAYPYSASNEETHFVYRYTQLAEVAASKAMGKPLQGDIRLENSAEEFSALLDGSEEIVGIMNIPVYIRDIYEIR